MVANLNLRVSSGFKCCFIDVISGQDAVFTLADQIALVYSTELRFQVRAAGRVHESETIQSHSCGSFIANESRFDVKDIRIKEPISLVIVSIVLIIEGDFDWKHVWLCVLRNLASDLIICGFVSFYIDSIFRVSKSHPEILAIIIWTVKVLSLNLDSLIIGRFHRSIWWSNFCDGWSVIIFVGIVLVWRDDPLPVLLVV